MLNYSVLKAEWEKILQRLASLDRRVDKLEHNLFSNADADKLREEIKALRASLDKIQS